MKAIFICWALLYSLASVSSAQEVRRPTRDIDGGPNTALGCFASVNDHSTSMPLAHDAAGLATSSTQTTSGNTVSPFSHFATRIFDTWQTTSNAYTSLTLNFNGSNTGWRFWAGYTGQACIAYSTDSGATWTSISCDSTFSGNGWGSGSVTLNATQDLRTLKVGICTEGNGNKSITGTEQITLFDIWTTGLTTPQGAGSGSSTGSPHRGTVVVN